MSSRVSELKCISTPSRNLLSIRSAAGSHDYLETDVRNDLRHDLANAAKCDFDYLLRHVLYLCLADDEKKKFEKILVELESVQAAGYQTSDTDGNDADALELARAREDKLLDDRDEFIKPILDMCLAQAATLATTHSASRFKVLLEDYSATFKTTAEVDRYKPYAKLCNEAFCLLESEKWPALREASVLDIVLCTSDPTEIVSYIGDPPSRIRRKPDLVFTSRKAGMSVRNGSTEFGDAPSESYKWSQALCCNEMKKGKTQLHYLSAAVLKSGVFDARRKVVFPHKDIETEFPYQNGKKRARPDDGGSASKKKPRGSGLKSKSRSAANVSATTSMEISESVATSHAQPRVQTGTYALEMLSRGPGVLRAFNLLTIDERVYVLFYDRHGTILSDGISLIADFPRFLVLLLAFQRFNLEDWGIAPYLDSESSVHLGLTQHPHDKGPFTKSCPINTDPINEIQLALNDQTLVKTYLDESLEPSLEGLINVHMDKLLSHKPHALASRATTVVEATCGALQLALKICHPEAQRPHEGDTLQLAAAIAKKKSDGMEKHLPKMYFYADIRNSSTQRIRSMLNINAKGFRNARILIMARLEKLPTRQGNELVKAWLKPLHVSHAFLWKHGVEHGDPSLWNVMYDPTLQCGVLTDFDLAILQWLPRIPGTDRTGTIPFMAIDLLRDIYYHHELEAFIWILPFVFLAYENNKLMRDTRYIKEWMTSDHNVVRQKKKDFLDRDQLDNAYDIVRSEYDGCASMMYDMCTALRQELVARAARLDKFGRKAVIPQDHHLEESRTFWAIFLGSLEEFEGMAELKGIVSELKKHQPDFDLKAKPEDSPLFTEMRAIHQAILTRSF